MSCPDWSGLTDESRDDAQWLEAIEHSRSCRRCRQESTATDPLSVFARLDGRELDPDEAEIMVSRVRGARSLRRTDVAMERDHRRQATRRQLGGLLSAAVLLLAVGVGVVSRDDGVRESRGPLLEVAAGSHQSHPSQEDVSSSSEMPETSATARPASASPVGGPDELVLRQLQEHLNALPVVDVTLVTGLSGDFEVAESSSVEFQLASAQWDLVWVVDSELEL